MKTVFFAIAIGMFVLVGRSQAALFMLSDVFKGTNTPGNYSSSVGSVSAITSIVPPWFGAGQDWINNSATGNATIGPGTVTYTHQAFNLIQGLSPVNTPIAGFIEAPSFDFTGDNDVTVFVNGSQVGATRVQGFASLGTINLAGLLKVGSNTISFSVLNRDPDAGPSPSGLFVTNVKGKFDNGVTPPPPAVPEPISIALWGGLCGLGLVARRLQRKNS